MNYRGSMVANDIITEWNREKKLKSLYEAKQRRNFKCKVDDKMQCDICRLRDNCEDREIKDDD